ncbi:MAG: DUF177 domain-containing protein [Lactobacillus sp.]|nr:DUF177 domain-containing protein [Lactobacillus sp.]
MLSLNFSRIKNSGMPLTHIDQEVEVRPEFLERAKDLLFEVKNIHVTGDLFYDEPYVTGNFQVSADLVVPSSRSLKPVPYHEEFTFTENYSRDTPSKDELEENSDPIVKVENDTIDLQTAVEDNILLNIPAKILTEKESKDNIYPEGNGWEVISQAAFDEGKKNQINPAFEKLKDLFPDQDKDK